MSNFFTQFVWYFEMCIYLCSETHKNTHYKRLEKLKHTLLYQLRPISFVVLAWSHKSLHAQSFYTPLSNSLLNSIEDSLHHIGSEIFTTVKPYTVGTINTRIDNYNEKLKLDGRFASETWLGRKIFNEDLIQKHTTDFDFRLNPLFHVTLGKDNQSTKGTYQNTRGIQADGRIGKNFYFYSEFLENQAYYPKYQRDWVNENRVIPGQGQFKSFGKTNDAYDFAAVKGHIEYQPSKFFNFRYGYGQNFIGDGYRSLLLSDNAFNYPYLRITTNFWKIQYTNIFAQMQDIRFTNPNGTYPRKYVTSHVLSANISKRLNISVFETVVYGDSANTRGYDFHYLNPIIFYRPLEFALGSSSGNVLMGLNMKYKLTHNAHVYGQFILDEFYFKEITAGKGWWANKFGYQIGIKSFNTFVPNLTVQTEYNWVRPFTYSHFDVYQNYGHYNQPLAHPLGSNFKESVTWLRYRYKRVIGELQIMYAQQGRDTANSNWGTRVYKNYNTRTQDYNNAVGQGVSTSTLFTDAKIAYLVNPKTNLRLEVGVTLRRFKTAVEKGSLQNETTKYVYFGLHSDIRKNYFDF